MDVMMPTDTAAPEAAPGGAAPAAPPAAPPHTVSHMFGEIVWLLTQSPIHRHLKLADLEWLVMPPLLAEQYRIYRDGTKPVGVVTWGYLSEEAEARLTAGERPQVGDWKSGDRCWIIDLVAPTTTAENLLAARMLDDLRQTALKGKAFKLQQTDPKTGERKVVEVGALQDSE
ncbi:toxin-activating lysine-acyltransferase [Nitrospirillum pindoramense]|uniref:RTX toxin-activating lysine-acyltransferase n=1 Tax=Nitrospirillum amazonense TaxID=28077 RepID=A0A560GYV5_9PROT|nr:toxin-activating lysine-acyltransferase [Nitrospirillum amazonense]TWB39216.1 cytolysin-activating lysine-acyltransferase [Nitrospirillum amazonense]